MNRPSTPTEPPGRAAGAAGLHPTGDMLTAHLLAMLQGWSAYGYELVQRLNAAGLGDYNKGTVYRALRHMEQVGLVSSMWDTSTSGPARRVYTLTQAGSGFLNEWLVMLDVHRRLLEQFLGAGSGRQASRRAPPPGSE